MGTFRKFLIINNVRRSRKIRIYKKKLSTFLNINRELISFEEYQLYEKHLIGQVGL